MTRTAAGYCHVALACCLAFVSFDAASAQIFKDDFETGTADTNIPATGPWYVNDISPSVYRTANNPFDGGSVYAELTDPGTGTAPSQATRLLSSNAADAGGYSPLINAKVTTLSFDFWETLPDVVDTQPGFAFGYYRLGAIDLNAAGRSFRGFLHNGMLSPDNQVVGAGAAVAYEREQVHTVFMVANDTADAPLANYRDGLTLAPLTADVWISLNGAPEVYAFSVNRQNVGMALGGFGFRTFNPDVEQFFIDNVLVVDGASFDRSAFEAPDDILGDYNRDQKVDGNDFLKWQADLGSPVTNPRDGADGSGNLTVDEPDLGVWKQNYGEPNVQPAVVRVPEPAAAALLLPIGFVFARRRTKR